MSYWIREIGGWIVLILGLAIFGLVYDLLLHKRIFEAGPLAFIGFVVFRGGIHLLKVAMAARTAREAVAEMPAVTTRRALPGVTPRVTPTDARRTMPGPQS